MAEKKKNIFTRFDWIKERAGMGVPSAVHFYFYFTDQFTKNERDLIGHFRNTYESNNNNITALESYSDNQIIVVDRFQQYVEWLPKNRFSAWLRWKFGRTLREKKFAGKNAKVYNKEHRDLVYEQQFLKHRYFEQQQYYSKTADKNKKRYYRLQKWIQGLSLAVSVISLGFICWGNYAWSGEGNDQIPRWFSNLDNLTVAIVSAIAAFLSSSEKLCRNLEFWLKFRTTSERLKTEHSLYQGHSGPYKALDNTKDDFGNSKATQRFREKVEQIIQNANDNFEQIVQGRPQTAADKYGETLTSAAQNDLQNNLDHINDMKRLNGEIEAKKKELELLNKRKDELDKMNEKMDK